MRDYSTATLVFQIILAAGLLLFILQTMGEFIASVVGLLARLAGRGDTSVYIEQEVTERPSQARRGDPLTPDEEENAGWIANEFHRREIGR